MQVQIRKTPVFISLSIGLLFYGLFSTLISVVILHLKEIFGLSYSISSLIHLTFFSTYIIASIPASRIVKAWGYKLSLIIGYFTTGLGCMMFYFGINIISYPLLISSLFVMAVGSTVLLVVCNLYIVLLGDYKKAAARLSFLHSFYALGCLLAPLYGSEWIKELWGITADMDMDSYIKSLSLYIGTPFIIMSNLMYFLTVIFVFLNMPEFDTQLLKPWNQFAERHKKIHVMHFKQLRLGAFAVFAYIGTEVALSEYLVTFFSDFTYLYWAGYVAGLLIGSILLLYISPRKMLLTFTLGASVLMLFAIFSSGLISLIAVSAIGFFNSILFPTIWSLSVKGLGRFSEQGAAIMVMAHVGGGIIPFNVVNFSGAGADKMAFMILVLCYAYIIFYAIKGATFVRNEDFEQSTLRAMKPSK
ncbi:MAG: fucP [Chitinophagaceae bacterium]|nr:fucP [Chitinophagaceae bacterium]